MFLSLDARVFFQSSSYSAWTSKIKISTTTMFQSRFFGFVRNLCGLEKKFNQELLKHCNHQLGHLFFPYNTAPETIGFGYFFSSILGACSQIEPVRLFWLGIFRSITTKVGSLVVLSTLQQQSVEMLLQIQVRSKWMRCAV